MMYTSTSKKITLLGMMAGLIIIAGCGQTTAPVVQTTAPTAETITPAAKILPKDITIANFQFSPTEREIIAGEPIQWINNDNVPHVIVADDNSFQSPTLQAGESFVFLFVQTGTFAYHCSIHPSMKGTIIVK